MYGGLNFAQKSLLLLCQHAVRFYFVRSQLAALRAELTIKTDELMSEIRLVSFQNSTISSCNCLKFFRMTMQFLQSNFLCNLYLFLLSTQRYLYHKTPSTFDF